MKTGWWLWLLPLLVATPLHAHEMRPAYAELVRKPGDMVQITFRQPAVNGRILDLELVVDCTNPSEKVASITASALTESWTMHCEAGFAHRVISVIGLNRTLTDVLVRVQDMDGTERHFIIRPGDPVLEIGEGPPPVLPVYLVLGIEHLLSGFDHILFVVGLMLLIAEKWKLVQTITAFTIAHSITLALSSLDVVRVSQQPVEAAIALSILYVAVEISLGKDADPLTRRYPWLIAFTFGLLHGLGFAGVLRNIGLPEGEALWALLLFNLGIEVGQLLVIAGMLALLAIARRLPTVRTLTRKTALDIRLVPAYVIGSISTWWFLVRAAAL